MGVCVCVCPGPLSRTTQVSRYQKGKTNLDFAEARASEWQWHQLDHMQVCTLFQTDNHASTPPLSFLQAGCPSCRPTNSVKALKVTNCWIFVERDRYARLCSDDHIDVINAWNVYLKFLINAFVIFVNVYYVNKRHMKCRKLFEAVNNISGVNSAYCCTDWNFEFTRSAKCLQSVRKNANVYCQRLLTFVIFS